MDEFGVKRAIKEIADGNTIKMISTDFKCHLFAQHLFNLVVYG